MAIVTGTTGGLRMVCTITIGDRRGANMSGENVKGAGSANGAAVNGESMSAGNENSGTIGIAGDRSRSPAHREEERIFMRAKSAQGVFAIAMLFCPLTLLFGQNPTEPNDYRALIRQGNEALNQNRLGEAARAYQHAIDLNPSSARAHEGLGAALLRELTAGNVRASAYSDIAERAESHLTQASELSPSAPAPLLELSELQAFLAEHSTDMGERADRYKKAQEALKQAISLEPSDPKIYLRLASVEHDEFGPVLQQAKARFAKTAGPIPDTDLRHSLQEQYGAAIDDAIGNAQRASEMNGNAQRPLLLLSRLFRERALIRDTQEEYATDMQTAKGWQRQFLAVGGHIADTKSVK